MHIKAIVLFIVLCVCGACGNPKVEQNNMLLQQVEGSLKNATVVTKFKNHELLTELELYYRLRPERLERYVYNARVVDSLSKSFVSYLDSLIATMNVIVADGANSNVLAKLFKGGKYGEELKTRINESRVEILKFLDTADQHHINTVLIAKDNPETSKRWGDDVFADLDNAAVLVLLKKFKLDVLVLEENVLSMIKAGIGVAARHLMM
jgi:5-methylcytosine-specific restriction endonuclease McrBC GTP-binding regulatory subunit McrB